MCSTTETDMEKQDSVLRLCPKCFPASRKRIDAATYHNADKSVDWWVKWWEKEEERQMICFRKHRYDGPYVA